MMMQVSSGEWNQMCDAYHKAKADRLVLLAACKVMVAAVRDSGVPYKRDWRLADVAEAMKQAQAAVEAAEKA